MGWDNIRLDRMPTKPTNLLLVSTNKLDLGMNVSTVDSKIARRIRDAHWLLKLGTHTIANNSNTGFAALMDSLMGSEAVAA